MDLLTISEQRPAELEKILFVNGNIQYRFIFYQWEKAFRVTFFQGAGNPVQFFNRIKWLF